MGLVNTAKDYIDEYRQRYLQDRRKFLYQLRMWVGKKENRLFRVVYGLYKWLFILPLLALSTLICGILAMVTTLVVNQRIGSLFGVIWARINSFFTPMTVEVIGRENINPGSSYVICANHQSHYDIYVLYGWLGVDFKWVMKKELEKVPVLGPACKMLGHIFIDRSDSKNAIATINAAKSKITQGSSVVFFPEGSRSTDGILKPFKKGAFRMALDLELPILPGTICGTRNILPKGSIDLRPGAVKLVIHRPISTTGFSEADLESLMERTKMAIDSSLK
jgi:1-acyl-sn-glycerol-3-phosphate acyltransferase